MKYRKPLPIYKWIEHPRSAKHPHGTETIAWNGNCFMCGTDTIPIKEKTIGSIIGKSSVYCDTIGSKCQMIHYAEEHDD